jgi:ATP-binding cassette subfamily C protein LapB
VETGIGLAGLVDEARLVWLAQRLAALHPGCRRLSRRELLALGEERAGRAGVAADGGDGEIEIELLFEAMGLQPARWESQPRHAALPMVAVLPGIGCRLIYGRTADGLWMTEGPDGTGQCRDLPEDGSYSAVLSPPEKTCQPTALAMFKSALKVQKGVLAQVALATVLGNFLALGGSLYSMQVYDRVIPTQGISTLVVLTTGVLIAALLELVLKGARSAILEHALKDIDLDLSHRIFLRLLNIRMDQFPASVGTLSSQVRSYESIRAFASSAVLYLAVDVPFAIIFLVVIVMLAGPLVAAVPALFFVLALGIGMFFRKRIQDHAQTSTAASNRKLGLLVETVEGAESVKTSGAGWHLLNRWSALSRESVAEDLQIRQYSEHAAHLAAFMQQASYVMLVCVGAYIAATTNLTMGALIACSILSGRVLAPVGMLPGLLVQWGQSKAALDNLEKVFTLQNDNHGVTSPLAPERVNGRFQVADLRFAYRGRSETLALDSLAIAPGEKVGILGVVGAGKSTLLKLLAGIYLPQQGRVLLDGLDIQHISRACLAEQLGYLPQEIRLFAGTLRDNLLFGLAGVSEQDVLSACETTGLIGLVSGHAKGLDLEIAEGGSGVSGGQKQLIAFTRLLLSRPNVLLLDEPTSAMDESTEARTLSVLRGVVSPQQTMVLVTHKPALVGLVDRLVILTPAGIVLDGPRDAVLQKLRQRDNPAPAPVVVQARPVVMGEA